LVVAEKAMISMSYESTYTWRRSGYTHILMSVNNDGR